MEALEGKHQHYRENIKQAQPYPHRDQGCGFPANEQGSNHRKMQHNLPATQSGSHSYTLLPLHGLSPGVFLPVNQSTQVYGNFLNTPPFCDRYCNIFPFRLAKVLEEKPTKGWTAGPKAY
ncbi:hypothetical protein HMPREF0201_01139 [Cedecea davisae DSM 4568]|uniref:Uncharacterized protein n=1 Tax=Cedecea davisae DSM 4568 TaxID=566551 RepID=S3J006_9ENTR|nr:hypothetical protein HMPREF0201_01139 [Cedecea davisae DSM 4568]